MPFKTQPLMNVRLQFGQGVVVLRYPNRSRPALVGILGEDLDGKGNVWRVYLDRLIHRPDEREADGWQLSGAISTVLTRLPEAAESRPAGGEA